MLNWLALIIIGVIIYAITYAPVFPAEWNRFARFLGGIFILIGLILLLLVVFNVALPYRKA